MKILVLLLLAASPSPRPLPGGLAALTSGAERIALPPRQGFALRQDALLGAVEIDAADPRALTRYLRAHPSSLCPLVEERPGGVRLRCAHRRFEAQLGRDSQGLFVHLVELRGLPLDPGEDGPPQVFYDSPQMGLSACPGRTPGAQAECLLKEGHRTEAALRLREALSSEPAYAALRLGDLAVAAGEPELAASWYLRARRQGIWARLALVRECELTGACFERLAATFEAVGLPEPARTEMELRYARTRMLLGQTAAAVGQLTRRILEEDRPAACALAPGLCRRLALAALRDPGPEGPAPAIALWLALPSKERGAGGELTREMAEACAQLGAPQFAANVLASASRARTVEDLEGHLARTAELYLAAGDRTRASVILEYARSRLTPRQVAGARWKAIVAALAPATAPDATAKSPSPDPAAELAQAAQTVARARSLRPLEDR